jgi:tRNA(Arg) A34 adenosine deaminase TadA
MSNHTELIRVTFELAAAARRKGNHPFVALLAQDGRILLTAENSVSSRNDLTRHAELNLVSEAARLFEPELFAKVTLYTSTEPCAMCAGAIYWAGIPEVVYGCSAETLGALAGGEFVVPCRHVFGFGAHEVTVIGPVLAEEALVVHEDFWS